MFRDISFYVFSIVIFIVALIYVVPNLSTNSDDYQHETKILESTRIDREEVTRKFVTRIEKTLVLSMTDGTEIRLSDQYIKHWSLLQEEIMIGKKITYYLGNNTRYGSNPVQLEIDNFVVYTPAEGSKWRYAFVLLVCGAMVYTVFGIRKYVKQMQGKTN